MRTNRVQYVLTKESSFQFDGSYHDWFSDGTEYCLLAAIDDATGVPTLLMFEEHEGVLPVFRFWSASSPSAANPPQSIMTVLAHTV